MRRIGIGAGVALLGLVPGAAMATAVAMQVTPDPVIPVSVTPVSATPVSATAVPDASIPAAPASAMAAPATENSPVGASAGTPLQPGGWGQGGWQSGTVPAPVVLASPSGAAAHDTQADRARSAYRRPQHGDRVPHVWLDPVYTVGDWQGWGLTPPAPGGRWVRYYDDAVLIDANSRVVDARYNLDWAHGYRRAAGYGAYASAPPAGAYAPSGVTTYRAGPNTIVTTSTVPGPPPVLPLVYTTGNGTTPGTGYAGYGAAYGASSVVSSTPGTITTTTTTTTDYETVYKSVAVRKRAARRSIQPRRIVRTSTCAVGS